MKPLLLLASAALAAPALAQVQPQPLASDPRIQVVDYHPDQIVQIQAAPGFQLMLQLGQDELIENVAVGNSAAWQVTANRRGDLVFIKPIQDGVTTNLTIATDARLYLFELSPLSGGWGQAPFAIRFRYPVEAAEASTDSAEMGEIQGYYRLTGARALRPSRIGDDGRRTYIEWPEDRPLPAIYTIDGQGNEALVNGNMRGGYYVIDTVLAQLLFRIDRDIARAVRLPPEENP